MDGLFDTFATPRLGFKHPKHCCGNLKTIQIHVVIQSFKYHSLTHSHSLMVFPCMDFISKMDMIQIHLELETTIEEDKNITYQNEVEFMRI